MILTDPIFSSHIFSSQLNRKLNFRRLETERGDRIPDNICQPNQLTRSVGLQTTDRIQSGPRGLYPSQCNKFIYNTV